MKLIGKGIQLGIDEPWETSRSIQGVITGLQKEQHGKSHLFIRDQVTGQVYIITSRYVGEDVLDIVSRKTVIVAIRVPSTAPDAYDDPVLGIKTDYIGIGGIELLG